MWARRTPQERLQAKSRSRLSGHTTEGQIYARASSVEDRREKIDNFQDENSLDCGSIKVYLFLCWLLVRQLERNPLKMCSLGLDSPGVYFNIEGDFLLVRTTVQSFLIALGMANSLRDSGLTLEHNRLVRSVMAIA